MPAETVGGLKKILNLYPDDTHILMKRKNGEFVPVVVDKQVLYDLDNAFVELAPAELQDVKTKVVIVIHHEYCE